MRLEIGDAMTGSFRSFPLAVVSAGPRRARAPSRRLRRFHPLAFRDSPVPTGPLPPASFAPEDIVGRWGLGAYHRPEDRARTEAAARSQCKQPYVINRSSTGVSMLGYDNPQVQDMFIKGDYDGKTYSAPAPSRADRATARWPRSMVACSCSTGSIRRWRAVTAQWCSCAAERKEPRSPDARRNDLRGRPRSGRRIGRARMARGGGGASGL